MRIAGTRGRVAVAAGVLIALALPASTAHATRAVYATESGAPKVIAMTIGSGGGLTPVSGSPFAAGNGPAGVVMTPNGRALYVADSTSNAVSGYTVDGAGGLTAIPGSPFAAGTLPRGIAVSPDDLRLYVSNFNGDNVSAYDIGNTGALTPVAGSPFAAGDGPLGIALTPNGVRLYVSDQNAGKISVFDVGSGGALSASGAPPQTLVGAAGLAITPDGAHLYATGGAGKVAGYAIGGDGSLTPLGGSPWSAGSSAAVAVAVTPDGGHLFVTTDQPRVYSYAVGSDGTLSAAAGSPFSTSMRPHGAAITPDGTLLYVGGDNDGILPPPILPTAGVLSAYGIGGAGVLSPVTGSPFAEGVPGPTEFSSVTTTPNQGPVAAFTVAPAKPGLPAAFNASASLDADGTIARYDWNFGDGTSLPDGGPTPTHAFPGLAAYTVTLRVTDNEGCSVDVVYTGQTASCNGGSRAQVQRTVDLDPPRVTVGGKRIQRLGPAIVIKASCDEAALAVGRGKLIARTSAGQRDRHQSAGRVISMRLKPASALIAPNTPGPLKFKLSRHQRSVVSGVLERGGKASANINVDAFDQAGNEDSQLIRVQLR